MPFTPFLIMALLYPYLGLLHTPDVGLYASEEIYMTAVGLAYEDLRSKIAEAPKDRRHTIVPSHKSISVGSPQTAIDVFLGLLQRDIHIPVDGL
jgi:hypothetical protein